MEEIPWNISGGEEIKSEEKKKLRKIGWQNEMEGMPRETRKQYNLKKLYLEFKVTLPLSSKKLRTAIQNYH